MPADRRARRDTPRADTALYRPPGVLTVTAPEPHTGRSVAVDPTGTVLGRDPACHLALSNEHISRRHAVVRSGDGGYVVEDLGSRNGTMVNGNPVLDVVPLHDGDRLTLADVEVEFRLTGAQSTAPDRSEPRPGEAWWPDEPTEPSPHVRRRSGEDSPRSLRHELQDASGFSFPALLLAVTGSVVGTVLTSAAGTGPWGTLAGAALAPVVGTAFTTKRAGEKGRVRAAAIIMLSAAALFITWASVSLADLAAGNSVLPGTGERPNTFPAPNVKDPMPQTAPTVRQELRIEAIAELDCGTAAIGSTALCPHPVTIKNTGTGRLHITTVELTGSHMTDFTAGQECADVWIAVNDICAMTVRFHPSAAGPRRVMLVIHQNLPLPDRGTNVSITGVGGPKDPDACIEGYVWREAVAGDHVCVTPETRLQAQRDTQLAESHRSPNGGEYGPDTCIEGYVWREAVTGDHVCVTPATRALTQQDNTLRDSRRVG